MVVSLNKEAHLFPTQEHMSLVRVWDPGVGSVMCVCVGSRYGGNNCRGNMTNHLWHGCLAASR